MPDRARYQCDSMANVTMGHVLPGDLASRRWHAPSRLRPLCEEHRPSILLVPERGIADMRASELMEAGGIKTRPDQFLLYLLPSHSRSFVAPCMRRGYFCFLLPSANKEQVVNFVGDPYSALAVKQGHMGCLGMALGCDCS